MNISSVNHAVNVTQHNPHIVLSEVSTDILQKLKKINESYFYKPDQALTRQISDINAVELRDVLKCYFEEMVEEGHITDPVKLMDRLAAVIPIAKMEEAINGDVVKALNEAKGMYEEAKYYLSMTQEKVSPSIQARILSILDGMISVIESLIMAFGIGDFFKPADNEVIGDFKSQKIMLLVSMISMLTAIVLPLLGPVAGGLIIGGTMLAITALSVIWPYIKPRTTHLPGNAENWTKQVQNGVITAEGRKESLDEIANIMKMNRHAILVGPPRVGKSLTAKAFAQAIERGDYPELAGKTVFRINTTDIAGHQASFLGGGNNILYKISEAMGRHRDDIILVLDEIHMACKNNEKIADQLKTFLDEGGDFPHVIGITTEKEYIKHVKNNIAFSLRFDRVDIKNTNRDETLKILANAVLRSRSSVFVKEGALEQIYNKSCETAQAPQPASALKILKQCIHKTEKTQKSQTERSIIEVSNKILFLRSQAVVSRGRKKDGQEQIAELEKQHSELQAVLSKEQMGLNKLDKSRRLFDRVTRETYSVAIKISSISQKTLNAKDEKQLKVFLLLQEFLGRTLESRVAKSAEGLNVRVAVDDDLINEVAEPIRVRARSRRAFVG